jgi:hypothetical protein
MDGSWGPYGKIILLPSSFRGFEQVGGRLRSCAVELGEQGLVATLKSL